MTVTPEVAPTTKTVPVRQPVPRRARGYITDFGHGRRCAVAGCTTVISRYHSGVVCWVHDDQPPKR